MNKALLDKWIPVAAKAIQECEIVNENNVVQAGFRGQISSFGAAVAMGSLLSAVAAFSDNGSSAVPRANLMKAIFYILKDEFMGNQDGNQDDNQEIEKDSLYRKILEESQNASTDGKNTPVCNKENVLTAAIAIKLALKLYPSEKDSGDCNVG